MKINQRLNFIVCTILPVFVLGLITVVLNLKVFPITEGWWETYAWLSKTEKIYVDFQLALPPLYTNIISIILEYTNKIIYIRWILLVIYFINLYLMYILCKKLTKSSFAIIGVFVAQILIINNNPVWLSKDYHTLVSLLVTIFVIVLYGLISNGKRYLINSLALGFITALLVLTKQNIALICFLSAILTIAFNKNTLLKIVLKSTVIYIASLLATLSLYSYINSWNWINVYLNNDSKGGTSTILLRFVTDHGIAKISWRVLGLFLAFLILQKIISNNNNLLIVFKEYIYRSLNFYDKYISIKIEIIGYFIIFILFYFIFQKNETTGFYSLMLSYFCINLYKYFSDGGDHKFQLISINLLMLAYAGTMTAGYNNVSLELLIAIFVTIFLNYISKIFSLSKLAITFIVLILSICLFFTQKINKNSYDWWGYSTDSVRNSNYYSNNPKLKDISIDYTTKEILDAVDSAISVSKPTDLIFTYPSIPIFYWLYDKKPLVNSIVQWFDVMPSSHTNRVIKDLEATPPKFILWLKPPSFVYQGHLMMKKTQLSMNVIDDYIYDQINNGGYRIIKTIPIFHGNDNANTSSYLRYVKEPISYQFLCSVCSNSDLNDMLMRGNILYYNKNMDYNNNNYIDINFKNKYQANLFISKYNLFPINQNDWIFYILEKN